MGFPDEAGPLAPAVYGRSAGPINPYPGVSSNSIIHFPISKAAGVEYTAHIYPGVNHGFHNDSTPRYDQAAAELSWSRTIEFFKKKLG